MAEDRREKPMEMPIEELKKYPEKTKKIDEDILRKTMSKFLKIQLTKQRREIHGESKEFDIVNEEHKVVGDIKRPERPSASGVEDSICKDIWHMEMLEKSTGERWRKMIVGWGNREFFDKFKDKYGSRLGDVEIFFIDDEDEVHKIR